MRNLDNKGFVFSGLAFLLIIPALLLVASYIKMLETGGETTALNIGANKVYSIYNSVAQGLKVAVRYNDTVAFINFTKNDYAKKMGVRINISRIGNTNNYSILVVDADSKIRCNGTVYASRFGGGAGGVGGGAWRTPTSVINACEPDDADESIDWDFSSSWKHTVKEEHWIAYDIGSSYTISKIRIYVDDPSTRYDPCEVTAIYVTDNPSSWGASKGSGSLGTSDWQEVSITPTAGRYVKIHLNTYDGGCGANRLGGSGNPFKGLVEFQVYAY